MDFELLLDPVTNRGDELPRRADTAVSEVDVTLGSVELVLDWDWIRSESRRVHTVYVPHSVCVVKRQLCA